MPRILTLLMELAISPNWAVAATWLRLNLNDDEPLLRQAFCSNGYAMIIAAELARLEVPSDLINQGKIVAAVGQSLYNMNYEVKERELSPNARKTLCLILDLQRKYDRLNPTM